MHYVYVNIGRIKGVGNVVLTIKALRAGRPKNHFSSPCRSM